jgi:hypothetical protein
MEWILILEKAIGQDQQDHQDRAAFGRRASRRRRKIPVNPACWGEAERRPVNPV